MANQLYTFNTKKPVDGFTYNGYNLLGTTLIPNRVTWDLFNRLKISPPKVIFKGTHDKGVDHGQIFDTLTVGGGSGALNTTTSSYDFTLGTASGDRVVRQSWEYPSYTPGNSHTAMLTGVMGAGSSASSQRIGLFDDSDGVFFEQQNQNFGVVLRSSVSGSIVNNRYEQSQFNLDKLDGTGTSKFDIDLTKSQIFHTSYEWLGVGIILFSVVVNGYQIPCHYIPNANIYTSPYMRTGSLPVRYESVNTGTTEATSDFKQICAMVMSEGDSVAPQQLHAVSRGITPVSVGTTLTPVISLRIDPNNPRILVNLLDIHIYPTGKKDIEWAIAWGGTLTGASWTDADSGFCEFDVSATALSGYEIRRIGYVNDTSSNIFNISGTIRKLAAGIDGTPETVTLLARTTSATANILGAINYGEIL